MKTWKHRCGIQVGASELVAYRLVVFIVYLVNHTPGSISVLYNAAVRQFINEPTSQLSRGRERSTLSYSTTCNWNCRRGEFDSPAIPALLLSRLKPKLHHFDLLWICCTLYNKSTTNRSNGVWALSISALSSTHLLNTPDLGDKNKEVRGGTKLTFLFEWKIDALEIHMYT